MVLKYVGGALPVIALVVISSMWLGVHKIDEGHIGLYWFGGALLNTYSEPGWHVMIPYLTRMGQVQITLQTDTVVDIPCGTSGGVMIYFDKIEVVNQLNKTVAWKTVKLYGVNYDKTWIFDKIHHEINQFCSARTLQEVYIEKFATLDESLATELQKDCDVWETGITIISIRVTKPRIPTAVRANYEEIEQQKTNLMVADQKLSVAVREEETKKMQAVIQAEKEAEVSLINSRQDAEVANINAIKLANVSKIRVEMEIKEKEAEKRKKEIEVEMSLEREKSKALARAYSIVQEAEATELMLSEEYLRAVLYRSLAKNVTIYFGDKLPKIFLGAGGSFAAGSSFLN